MVEDLIEGKDGQVRAAHIRTSNYKTTRPVAKLYLLEVHSEDCGKQNGFTVPEENKQSVDDTPQDKQQNTVDTNLTPVRNMRAATSKALQKIKEWSSILGPPLEDV